MQQSHPDQRLPRVAAGRADRRAALPGRIREIFELHGFASVETRAVEPVDRLVGKGGDADKEIYGVTPSAGGDEGDGDAARLGLHFDLTVPFARYVLENAGKLAFPFRRYQIQKAWRGERPQEGRYREFTQADIDVVDVGSCRPHFEAEMPLVVADGLPRCRSAGADPGQQPQGARGLLPRARHRRRRSATLRTVDKLDKIGPDGVADLLVEAGAARRSRPTGASRWRRSATEDASFVDQVRALGVEHPLLDEGLEELAAVVGPAASTRPGVLVADLQIARGLDYYTGTVYETQLVGHESLGLGLLRRPLRRRSPPTAGDLPRRRHLDRRLAGCSACSSARGC